MWKAQFVIVICGAVCLIGCGGGSDTPPASSSTTAAATTTTTTTASSPVSIPPPAPIPEPVPAAPVVTEPVQAELPYEPPYEPPVVEPVIVDCQTGLGPVKTYWSDGTVTGYSDYCQSVHDRVLQGEREANTPTCDGVTCTYPNGASYPDPNAVPDDRCTNQIDYANDPRSNAEINSIGASTGQCPAPIG